MRWQGFWAFVWVVLMSRGYGYWNKTLYGLDFSVLAWVYAAALLIAVTRDDGVVRAVFCNPIPEKLGLVAYGTYLPPLPLGRFLPLPRHPSQRTLGACFHRSQLLGVVVAIAVASVSWRWFEKPLVRRGHAYD
jgi:peptidoglycan/LPS O-acetylase OafA/YrhL